MTYYFTYGSNLNLSQIQMRCPAVSFIRLAKLKRYKLVFNHHASIEYTGNENDFVQGVIYKLQPSDELNLDHYEGIATNTYKKEYLTFSINNEKTIVMTYIKNAIGNNPPEKHYLNKIKLGYRFWNFDATDLNLVVPAKPVIIENKNNSKYTFVDKENNIRSRTTGDIISRVEERRIRDNEFTTNRKRWEIEHEKEVEIHNRKVKEEKRLKQLKEHYPSYYNALKTKYKPEELI